MLKRQRLAFFISGGGTTMEAMAKACLSGQIPIDIACVISSSPMAGGIEKARKLGILDDNIIVINPSDFRGGNGNIDRLRFGRAILSELLPREVTVITQNGWLPLTPEIVIAAFPDSIYNQHPAPVPEFGGKGMYGLAPHAARLEFVEKTQHNFWTEAVAHKVTPEFDKGLVVKSTRVDILSGDTPEILQWRVLPYEHQVQIALLQDIAAGNVQVIPRVELVLPGEESILALAKNHARQHYPHG